MTTFLVFVIIVLFILLAIKQDSSNTLKKQTKNKISELESSISEKEYQNQILKTDFEKLLAKNSNDTFQVFKIEIENLKKENQKILAEKTETESQMQNKISELEFSIFEKEYQNEILKTDFEKPLAKNSNDTFQVSKIEIENLKKENQKILFEKTKTESQMQREIEELIVAVAEMAAADGSFTPNEKKYLEQILQKHNYSFEYIEKKLKEKLENTEKETQIIDKLKEKGNDFEKLIVQKFDKKYFKLKSWAGDKYTNGVYAQNTLHPDLHFEFRFKENICELAVECKYRQRWFDNGIEWAKIDQLARYKEFAISKQIETFLVLGVGGTAKEPKEVFVIPLQKIEKNYLSKEELKPFLKMNFADKNFFFNYETKKLA